MGGGDVALVESREALLNYIHRVFKICSAKFFNNKLSPLRVTAFRLLFFFHLSPTLVALTKWY